MFALLSTETLNCFFLLSWLAVFQQVLRPQDGIVFDDAWLPLWNVATSLSYAFLYIVPMYLACRLPPYLHDRSLVRLSPWLAGVLAIVGSAMVQILLYTDRILYDLYRLHLNGLGVGPLVSPGGLSSLGSGDGTLLSASSAALALLCLQVLLHSACQISRERLPALPRRVQRYLLAAFLCPILGECPAYAFSPLRDYRPILLASERYPLYLPLTARSLARSLGIQPTPIQREMFQQQSDLHYPLRPLGISASAHPLNTVWIVTESFRGDTLDLRYTPRLWDFSNRAIRPDNHYNGGNLTQMGVFGMFYGLHGGYWDVVSKASQPPVLMRVLRQQNYQFRIDAAQYFSYPPFDCSVFVNPRPQDLHALDSPEPAWQRDVRNTGDLLRFVDRRLPDRPFFACLFPESSHANYSFRDETARIRPYLVNFNYPTTDFQAQTSLIKNRYLNAAREVDTQIGRLLQYLENQYLLENTAVVVLGDHGEEFMERSRWGHNTEFNCYQTGTVVVLGIPGQAPRAVHGIISHIDLPATLLPPLGVRNPPHDYSLGQDLLAADYHRDYAVSADIMRITYLGEDFKVSLPLRGVDRYHGPVSDGDDRPPNVEQQEAIRGPLRAARLESLQDFDRFSALPVGGEPSPRNLATPLRPRGVSEQPELFVGVLQIKQAYADADQAHRTIATGRGLAE